VEPEVYPPCILLALMLVAEVLKSPTNNREQDAVRIKEYENEKNLQIGLAIAPWGPAMGAASKLISPRLTPVIGNKLMYLFGKASGNAHNIQRSTDMARQLAQIGIFDNPAGA
jgi:hypothetical protein